MRGILSNRGAPDHWAVIPFDLLFENVTSSSLKLPKSNYVSAGEFPVIDQGEEFVGGYTNEGSLVHPGPVPAIIFGDHTRCVKFTGRPFVQGADGVKVLAPSPLTYAKYAYWALKSTDIPSKGYARHFSLLRKVQLPLPPEREQRLVVEAIESYFTRLDAAAAALERVQGNLKRYQASILKAAVEGRLVPTEADLARAEGRDYEHASVLLERILAERRRRWEESEPAKMKAKGKVPRDDKWKAKYKEPVEPVTTTFRNLPEGWRWASLAQLCETITDGDHQPPPQRTEGIPFLVIGNFKSGSVDLSHTRFVPQAYYDSLDEPRKPRAGDLLYTVTGSYGIPVRVTNNAPFCVQRHIAILRPTVHTNAEFLYYMLQSEAVLEQATSKATGTAQKTVGLASLRNFVVPLPPSSEQDRICATLEGHFSLAKNTASTAHMSRLRSDRLRQSLLKWAFEGKLVDQDPTDEPASRLLERIKSERESSENKKSNRRGRQKANSTNA
jgi:type I restriction enzyme S subunit